MKVNLDDLEAKAKAVNCPETWDATDFTIDDAIDGEFIGAMNPTTALSLIRVARAAKSLKHIGDQMREEDWDALIQLEEALKEIE